MIDINEVKMKPNEFKPALNSEQEEKIKSFVMNYEIPITELSSYHIDNDSGMDWWDEEEELYIQCNEFLNNEEKMDELYYELGFYDDDLNLIVDAKEIERLIMKMQPVGYYL